MQTICLSPKLNHQKGFTLVELLIALVVFAILAMVALPSYQDYITQARRAEAKAIVMRAALWMERNQSATFSYAVDATGTALDANSLTNVGLGQSPENGTAYYTIALKTPVAANTFEIRATPTNGQQTRDTTCAALVMNHLGQRGVASSATAAADFTSTTAKNCWAK